jgi:hypothetical protein
LRDRLVPRWFVLIWVLPFYFSIDLLHCSKGERVYAFPKGPFMQSGHGWSVSRESEARLTKRIKALKLLFFCHLGENRNPAFQQIKAAGSGPRLSPG